MAEMHSGRIHGCFPEDKVHYAATEGTFHDDPKTGLVVVRIGENNKITAKRRQANKRPRDDDTAEMALRRKLAGTGQVLSSSAWSTRTTQPPPRPNPNHHQYPNHNHHQNDHAFHHQ